MSPLFVISYDIPDNKRRKKLRELLKQYGTPVQKSVFEARLTLSERRELLRRAGQLLHRGEDQLIVYRLNAELEQQIEVLGLKREAVLEPSFYLV